MKWCFSCFFILSSCAYFAPSSDAAKEQAKASVDQKKALQCKKCKSYICWVSCYDICERFRAHSNDDDFNDCSKCQGKIKTVKDQLEVDGDLVRVCIDKMPSAKFDDF